MRNIKKTTTTTTTTSGTSLLINRCIIFVQTTIRSNRRSQFFAENGASTWRMQMTIQLLSANGKEYCTMIQSGSPEKSNQSLLGSRQKSSNLILRWRQWTIKTEKMDHKHNTNLSIIHNVIY